jgi:hypothetical protein
MIRRILAIAAASCTAAAIALPANAVTVPSPASPAAAPIAHMIKPAVIEGLADFKGISPDKALTLQFDSDDVATPIQNENWTGAESQYWFDATTNDCGDGAVNATCPFALTMYDNQFFGDPIVEIASGQYSNRCVRDRGDDFMESNKCSGVSGVDFVQSGYSFINPWATNNDSNGTPLPEYMTGGNADSTVLDKPKFTEGYSQYGVKS